MVIRVEKTEKYTVMSNHHLSNTKLSLKAKGLMSLMLSLPEDWDYTMRGLATICKDGVDSISATIKELEGEGYITRCRTRDERGRLTGTEYVIHEFPQSIENAELLPKGENPVLDDKTPKGENPVLDKTPKGENPVLDKSPKLDFPVQVNPIQGKPILENPAQSNTNILNTNILNNKSIYPSNLTYDEQEIDRIEIEELVKDNIEYDVLMTDPDNAAIVDELFRLMIDVLMSDQEYHSISKQSVHAREVKNRLRALKSEHILYVIDSIKKINSPIKNVKKYMLTSLYNACTTYHTSIYAGINGSAYRGTGTLD